MSSHTWENAACYSKAVRPWSAGLSYEELQSIHSWKLNHWSSSPPERRGFIWEVATLEVWQLLLKSKILKPNDSSTLFKCHPAISVIFLLLVNLTFSSIPPLMTGSGSGPVGMKITQESIIRLLLEKQLFPSFPACQDHCHAMTVAVLHHRSRELRSARSRVFLQLTFHSTSTYSITQHRYEQIIYNSHMVHLLWDGAPPPKMNPSAW